MVWKLQGTLPFLRETELGKLLSLKRYGDEGGTRLQEMVLRRNRLPGTVFQMSCL